MIRLVLFLAVAGLAVAEVAAPPYVESAVEDQVRERLGGVATVEADVQSFPLVARVLATGQVAQLDVELAEVAGQQIRFSRVVATMRGIELSRPDLLRGQVRVTGIEEGELLAAAPLGELAAVVGVAADTQLWQQAHFEGSELVLEAAGRTFRVPLPLEPPCDAAATVEGDFLVLRCTFRTVPSFMAQAAAPA